MNNSHFNDGTLTAQHLRTIVKSETGEILVKNFEDIQIPGKKGVVLFHADICGFVAPFNALLIFGSVELLWDYKILVLHDVKFIGESFLKFPIPIQGISFSRTPTVIPAGTVLARLIVVETKNRNIKTEILKPSSTFTLDKADTETTKQVHFSIDVDSFSEESEGDYSDETDRAESQTLLSDKPDPGSRKRGIDVPDCPHFHF